MIKDEQRAVVVCSRKICCSGDEEPFGHPTVTYVIPETQNFTTCLYCSRTFVYVDQKPRGIAYIRNPYKADAVESFIVLEGIDVDYAYVDGVVGIKALLD